jgi:hypothetical protein
MTQKSLDYWWSGPVMRLYCPLTYTVWGVTSLVAHVPTDPATGISQKPLPFHAVNLATHLLATFLAYRLLLLIIASFDQSHRAGRDDRWNPWLAALAALPFGLHPLQVENVAWIASLNGSLYGMFALAALLHYVRFAREGGAWRYTLASLFYILAIFSKPSAVTVPFIAMALDRLVVGRRWSAIAKALIPWLLPAAALTVYMSHLQIPARFDVSYPWLDRIAVAVDSWTFYLRKFLWPWPIGFPYGRKRNDVVQQNLAFYLWLFPVFVAALLAKFRIKAITLSALIYTFSLAPNLGLARFDSQYLSTVADRYAYLALFGMCVAIAWLLHRFGRRAVVLLLFAAAFWAVRSVIQIRTWHDTRAVMAQSERVWRRPYPVSWRWPGHTVWVPRDLNRAHFEPDTGLSWNEGP